MFMQTSCGILTSSVSFHNLHVVLTISTGCGRVSSNCKPMPGGGFTIDVCHNVVLRDKAMNCKPVKHQWFTIDPEGKSQ